MMAVEALLQSNTSNEFLTEGIAAQVADRFALLFI